MPSSSSHKHRHHKHDEMIEVDSASDASSSSTESESESGGGLPLNPRSNSNSNSNSKRAGGAASSSSKKKRGGGGGGGNVTLSPKSLKALAASVESDSSLAEKISKLFATVETIKPKVDYIFKQIKKQEQEDLELERELRKGKKKRAHYDDSDSGSGSDEDDAVKGKWKKSKKTKGGGGKSYIPLLEKWAQMLSKKLEQSGAIGQVPFPPNKERLLIVREHHYLSPEDARTLFAKGTLMQPTPHNKPHSALHVWKYWGKDIVKLFSPIPFSLRRSTQLFTTEGAAAAAAAKKEKKEKRASSSKKASGGNGEEAEAEAEEEEEEEEDEVSSPKGGGDTGGVACTLKTVPVVLTWMEGRWNADRLSVTLAFGFERDGDAEDEEELEVSDEED